MGKKLSEMTLEELWTLFPIILTEHRPEWKAWYLEQEARLRTLLPADALAGVHHIGSTAVPSICAKPIVDILIEVRAGTDFDAISQRLTADGWILMSRAPGRYSFNQGYTENGFAEKVFHLHLRTQGDCDEILFRDYLLSHPDEAAEYERLKLRLWKQFEHDRDGYTEAKGGFIRRCTGAARALQGQNE